MSEFRYGPDGKPLWHAPLPNLSWKPEDGYSPVSPFGACQLCGQEWPCEMNREQTAPVPVTGIWLRNGPDASQLEVLAEIDGEWRTVISQDFGDLVSYMTGPLGMRHAPKDRLTAAKETEND